MRDDREAVGHQIGYGKPPKSGQFTKGVSGNPLGRPKKAPDFLSALLRELNSPLPINENGKRRVIKKRDGVVKQLVNKAVSGHLPATRLLIPYYEQVFKKAEEERLRTVDDLTDAELTEILRATQKKEARRKKMRLEVIEPLSSTEADTDEVIRGCDTR